jgi:hypothetical protein
VLHWVDAPSLLFSQTLSRPGSNFAPPFLAALICHASLRFQRRPSIVLYIPFSQVLYSHPFSVVLSRRKLDLLPPLNPNFSLFFASSTLPNSNPCTHPYPWSYLLYFSLLAFSQVLHFDPRRLHLLRPLNPNFSLFFTSSTLPNSNHYPQPYLVLSIPAISCLKVSSPPLNHSFSLFFTSSTLPNSDLYYIPSHQLSQSIFSSAQSQLFLSTIYLYPYLERSQTPLNPRPHPSTRHNHDHPATTFSFSFPQAWIPPPSKPGPQPNPNPQIHIDKSRTHARFLPDAQQLSCWNSSSSLNLFW